MTQTAARIPADTLEGRAPLPDATLATLFQEARTHNAWRDAPVDNALLERVYELAKMAPTAANAQPLRITFVKSAAAKEKLRPALFPGNVDKTMQAPVTAILAYDLNFHEKYGQLFPARDMKSYMASLPAEVREQMATQSATLQAGYFILAARALGLDCGPMGGFDKAQVDAAFFPDGQWKSFLLVNLGHGDPAGLFPRNPRLSFDQAARVE